jgi:hypothetical protein
MAALGNVGQHARHKTIILETVQVRADGGYDSPHNAKITWEHHARQTAAGAFLEIVQG